MNTTTPKKDPLNPSTKEGKENAKKVAQFARDQLVKLQKFATDGNRSIKTMAFFGGLGMTATSFMAISASFISFSLLSMLLSFYTLLFGVITCLLEGKEYVLSASYETSIEEYARFLKYLWGRGCLYFFAGSLQISQISFVNFISGGYMCFVGIVYIIVGRSTANKLLELRHSVYTEDSIRKLFNEVDANKKGFLTREQFYIFLERMGVDMNKNEFAAAFSVIDDDNSRGITCDEFILWWNDFDNYDSLRNAQWHV